MSLTGTLAGTAAPIAGGIGGLFVTSSDVGSSKGPDYTAAIHDNNVVGTEVYKTTFNFDPASKTFIRKVFKTNPQSTGGVIPASTFSNGEDLYFFFFF